MDQECPPWGFEPPARAEDLAPLRFWASKSFEAWSFGGSPQTSPSRARGKARSSGGRQRARRPEGRCRHRRDKNGRIPQGPPTESGRTGVHASFEGGLKEANLLPKALVSSKRKIIMSCKYNLFPKYLEEMINNVLSKNLIPNAFSES